MSNEETEAGSSSPEAVAVLFDLAGEVNRTSNGAMAGRLKALGSLLGLLQRDAAAFLQSGSDAASGLGPEHIAALAREYAA